jgi:methylated-DNA-[protein]-cysteine S-methyltransferase
MSEYMSRTFTSPVGRIRLVATEEALLSVELPAHPAFQPDAPHTQAPHPVLDCAEREFGEYFRGARTTFTVPLAEVGTAFQREVWAALRTIPFGEQRSYAWLAREIGRPRAVRAVGAANGRNLLSIIVPCHRVIGSSGALTGYAGGVGAKQWLLAHERTGLPGAMSPTPREVGTGVGHAPT